MMFNNGSLIYQKFMAHCRNTGMSPEAIHASYAVLCADALIAELERTNAKR